MNVDHQGSFILDRESVRSLLVQLSIAHKTELPPRNQSSNLGADISQSKYAAHFIEQIRSTPYSCLYEVSFQKFYSTRAGHVLTMHSMLFCNRRV